MLSSSGFYPPVFEHIAAEGCIDFTKTLFFAPYRFSEYSILCTNYVELWKERRTW